MNTSHPINRTDHETRNPKQFPADADMLSASEPNDSNKKPALKKRNQQTLGTKEEQRGSKEIASSFLPAIKILRTMSLRT